MIKQSKNDDRAVLITGNVDADTIYKEFIEAPMNAARQPAMTTGLELLAFMTSLPDAFIASEERELKRLARTSETKNDARIERLKISIERAQEIRSNTNQGKARIERALASLSEQGNVFHGVVSDTDLNPRKGLTVRISAKGNDRADASRSATTDADGYFCIPLDNGKTDPRKKTASESGLSLSDRMAEFLSNINAKYDTPADKKASVETAVSDKKEEVLTQVEILDAGKNILHRDPSPLVVNDGTAYREYVIDGNQSGKPYDPPKPAPTKPGDSGDGKGGGTEPGKPYVGNPATLELHDTQKLTKRCKLDAIKPSKRTYFDSTEAAEKAGYDYCAFCFGKEKSKR